MRGVAILRIGLWVLVAVFAGAATALYFGIGSPRAVDEAAYGTPFQLVDQNGAPVTEAALRGKPSAVFFGFTHCPDVCPTTLSELTAYRTSLKAKNKDFRIVFVTVDPERDTPAVLKDYVGAFSPDITAVTGEPAKVAAMLKGWAVYSKKVGDGPDYTMDHTATTFLLDSAGRFSGTISYGENAKTAEEKLERLASL